MRKKRVFKKRYKIRRKKPLYKNKFFLSFILIYFVFGILFYFLFFSKFFQIKEIRIFGNEKVLNENLQKIVKKRIKRKIFFQSESIFLVNFSEIEKEILKEFPQIARANLKRKFPNILILEIKEREPFAIFCQEECFKVDREGIVFEKTEEKEGLLFYFKDKKEFSFGERIIAKKDLDSIFQIQKKLKDLEIEVEKFLISDKKLTSKTLQGFEIYFDLKGKIEDQIFNLEIVLKEKIPPEKRGEIQYIDLRFGNKVYYK